MSVKPRRTLAPRGGLSSSPGRRGEGDMKGLVCRRPAQGPGTETPTNVTQDRPDTDGW